MTTVNFSPPEPAVSRADKMKRCSEQKANIEEKNLVEEKRKEREDVIQKGTTLCTEVETTYLK